MFLDLLGGSWALLGASWGLMGGFASGNLGCFDHMFILNVSKLCESVLPCGCNRMVHGGDI